MFRSKTNPLTRCKKHPKHKQAPGVCSLCLSEKLSRLSSAGYAPASCAGRRRGYRAYSDDPSSSASSLSSSDISSCESSRMSPVVGSSYSRRHFRQMFSDAGGEIHGEEKKNKEKGKANFWSKLLVGPRRRTRMDEYQGQVISRSEPLMKTTSRVQ